MFIPVEAMPGIKSEDEIYDLTTPGPVNRQPLRQIFDGVLLPTLLSIRKQKAEEVREDFKKLKLLKDVSTLLI
jgi:hypothetical protein